MMCLKFIVDVRQNLYPGKNILVLKKSLCVNQFPIYCDNSSDDSSFQICIYMTIQPLF